MSLGLIGRKIKMTHIFDEQGVSIPVTIIKAGPCMVLDMKNQERDGYRSVRVCFEELKEEKLNMPDAGVYKNKKLSPHRIIKEFRCDESEEVNCNDGDVLDVDLFNENDFVDVIGQTKGKGFAGVVKRHNFSGGPKTHGSHLGRHPGSIGMCATPSRVHKGTKMPGRMGNARQTIQNLKIVKIDKENKLIMVFGSVPGRNKGLVYIKKALKKGNKN